MPSVFWYFLGLSLGRRSTPNYNNTYKIDSYKAKEYYNQNRERILEKIRNDNLQRKKHKNKDHHMQ